MCLGELMDLLLIMQANILYVADREGMRRRGHDLFH